jgi:TonB family protein
MRGALFILLLLALAGSTSAHADPPASKPAPQAAAVIREPDWARMPTADEMAQYWPAGSRGLGGHVVMECTVTAAGAMDNCMINSETPQGHGFGDAALAMSSLFAMQPRTRDGVPVGGARVIIPVGFAGEGAPATNPVSVITVLHVVPWTAAPTAEQLAAAYPSHARGSGLSARVVLRCPVDNDGGVFACDTISETPGGKGFSYAAVKLVRYFRIAAETAHRNAGRLEVDVPFAFRDPAQPASPIELFDPRWMNQPSADQLAALYPQAALKAGVTAGEGSVDCTITHDGALTACTVSSETPQSLGFGAAALQAVALMRVAPWTVQGQPVDGARITVPVHLTAPGAATATGG